jgi:hypothetical protein
VRAGGGCGAAPGRVEGRGKGGVEIHWRQGTGASGTYPATQGHWSRPQRSHLRNGVAAGDGRTRTPGARVGRPREEGPSWWEGPGGWRRWGKPGSGGSALWEEPLVGGTRRGGAPRREGDPTGPRSALAKPATQVWVALGGGEWERRVETRRRKGRAQGGCSKGLWMRTRHTCLSLELEINSPSLELSASHTGSYATHTPVPVTGEVTCPKPLRTPGRERSGLDALPLPWSRQDQFRQP